MDSSAHHHQHQKPPRRLHVPLLHIHRSRLSISRYRKDIEYRKKKKTFIHSLSCQSCLSSIQSFIMAYPSRMPGRSLSADPINPSQSRFESSTRVPTPSQTPQHQSYLVAQGQPSAHFSRPATIPIRVRAAETAGGSWSHQPAVHAQEDVNLWVDTTSNAYYPPSWENPLFTSPHDQRAQRPEGEYATRQQQAAFPGQQTPYHYYPGRMHHMPPPGLPFRPYPPPPPPPHFHGPAYTQGPTYGPGMATTPFLNQQSVCANTYGQSGFVTRPPPWHPGYLKPARYYTNSAIRRRHIDHILNQLANIRNGTYPVPFGSQTDP